jgi:ribonucleotide monophosphatase NagD (HAD superfamily)
VYLGDVRAIGLPARDVVMVGDGLRQGLLPAQRLSMTTVLVRTGMFREADLALGTPDVVLGSVAELMKATDDDQLDLP